MTRDSVIHPFEHWIHYFLLDCVRIAASLQLHYNISKFTLTDTEVESIMNIIQINFLHYSDRDFESNASYFEARVSKKRRDGASRKQTLREIRALCSFAPTVRPTIASR